MDRTWWFDKELILSCIYTYRFSSTLPFLLLLLLWIVWEVLLMQVLLLGRGGQGAGGPVTSLGIFHFAHGR
jgi:hypothetical protein